VNGSPSPAAMPGARPPAPQTIAIPGPLGPIHVNLPDAEPFIGQPQATTPPTAPRTTGPLYGLQFLRKEAVRLAIDSYRDTDRPTDEQLLATADVLAEFIRGGHLPDNPKKD